MSGPTYRFCRHGSFTPMSVLFFILSLSVLLLSAVPLSVAHPVSEAVTPIGSIKGISKRAERELPTTINGTFINKPGEAVGPAGAFLVRPAGEYLIEGGEFIAHVNVHESFEFEVPAGTSVTCRFSMSVDLGLDTDTTATCENPIPKPTKQPKVDEWMDDDCGCGEDDKESSPKKTLPEPPKPVICRLKYITGQISYYNVFLGCEIKFLD